MQIYLVGGAVRDQLLGLSVKEKDWVVVGATPEHMLAMGYKPVGKDFPVFLHPDSHDEYALARTERKVGKGYKGFTFYAAPEVTLEEDLIRRDLTINAIAQTADGKLIDPFNGQADLKNKVLKHVSDAFAEDPVRVLRLARFATRFTDFSVHPDTIALAKQMAHAGEINALVAERVWQEWERALNNAQPERFFSVLEQCDALPILFPNLKINDAGLEALIRTRKITDSGVIRLAALLHHLTLDEAKLLLTRYRVPNEYADLVLLTIKQHQTFANLSLNDHERLLDFLLSTDAIRRTQRFIEFAQACQIIHSLDHQRLEFFQQAITALKTIDMSALNAKKLPNHEMATAVKQLRLQALKNLQPR